MCRKVDLILRHFRDATDPGTIAPHQRSQVRGFKQLFSGLTTTEILTFQDKAGNDIKRPFSYINDPQEFKESIASIRKKDLKRLGTKYGVDNGQVISQNAVFKLFNWKNVNTFRDLPKFRRQNMT